MPSDKRRANASSSIRQNKKVSAIYDTSQHRNRHPHSEDMETALLRCMVLNWEVREECATQVPLRAFFEPKNQIIFSALLEWRKSRYPADFTGFKEQITKAGQLEEIGGLEYLSRSGALFPSRFDYRNNVKWVIDYYHRREAIAAGRQLIEAASDTMKLRKASRRSLNALFTKLAIQSTRRKKISKRSIVGDHRYHKRSRGTVAGFRDPVRYPLVGPGGWRFASWRTLGDCRANLRGKSALAHAGSALEFA